jgi:signal transduction histidine kinase
MKHSRWVRLVVPVVAGHLAAAIVFLVASRPEQVNDVWPLQFLGLLALSLAAVVCSIMVSGRGVQLALLLFAMMLHLVMGLPQGADMTVEFILAAVFLFSAVMILSGGVRLAIAAVYAAATLAAQRPVSAWGLDLPTPSEQARVLFVCWAAAVLWALNRMREDSLRLRDQGLQIERLDGAVKALSSANVDFQDYATRVRFQSQDEERRRITREIHDIVGYTLMNVHMMMEAALDIHAHDRPGLPELLARARDQAQVGLFETRAAMRSLRALPALETRGMARVHDIVRIFENATGVAVELNTGNCPDTFGDVLDDLLYRLVQESLANAFRHGNASAVTVNLWLTNGSLRVTISDNGVGAKEIVPGIGLAGMRERIVPLGGTIQAYSLPRGFRVHAELPLAGEALGDH